MNTTIILNKLFERQNLTKDEIYFLFEEIAKGSIDSIQLSAILVALRMKEESIDEIAAFVTAMRNHMLQVSLGDTLDTCGTGGDDLGTFNISTAVAFVIAGAGVKVAKHGSVAVSGKCGSADVLQELGVNITLTPQQAEIVFKNTHMVFLFVPIFHPVMKNVSSIRKSLGVRTIFNILAPFTNPASAKRQIIGVANKILAEKLAKVASKLAYAHVIIFSSDDGMDEISISAPTVLFDIQGGRISKKIICPEMFGLKVYPQKEIFGGDAQKNAEIITGILHGKKGPKRDIVVINSATALYAGGKVKNITDGIKLAEKSIDSGNARKVLDILIKETSKFAVSK